MKAPLGIALMVLVASAPTTFAQLPEPRPDLVIAGIVTSKQRVGVDETFLPCGHRPERRPHTLQLRQSHVEAAGRGRLGWRIVRISTGPAPSDTNVAAAQHGALPAQENGCVRILAPSDTKVACKGLDASRTSTENGSAAG